MAKEYVGVYRKLLASTKAGGRKDRDRQHPLPGGALAIGAKASDCLAQATTKMLIEES